MHYAAVKGGVNRTGGFLLNPSPIIEGNLIIMTTIVFPSKPDGILHASLEAQFHI